MRCSCGPDPKGSRSGAEEMVFDIARSIRANQQRLKQQGENARGGNCGEYEADGARIAEGETSFWQCTRLKWSRERNRENRARVRVTEQLPAQAWLKPVGLVATESCLKEHPADLVSAWGRPSFLSGLPFFQLRGKRGRRKTIVHATLRASGNFYETPDNCFLLFSNAPASPKNPQAAPFGRMRARVV
jgi:hypothetical protein